MLPVLQFVFSGFWTWAGMTIMLGVVANGSWYTASVLASAFRGWK